MVTECTTGPEVIKLFSYATQISMKFIILINVKMPKSVLTFMSRIHTTHVSYKAKIVSFLQKSSFHEPLKVHAQLS